MSQDETPEVEDSSDHVIIEMAGLEPTKAKDDEFLENVAAPAKDKPEQAQAFVDANKPVLTREQREEEFDQEMLRRAIADTGRWAYGTISVEAWIFDEKKGKLVRPKRAFWFDPVVVNENRHNESLMRLVDDTRSDFVGPDDLAPGIGLAGALFSELAHVHRNSRRNVEPSYRTKNRLARNEATLKQKHFGTGVSSMLSRAMGSKHVAWREVEPISNDPDQPFNLRLQLLVEAGIGFAAGVKFQFRGVQGLVLYMARSTTDMVQLKSETNEEYLLSAADVIGSIVCLRGPRRGCVKARCDDFEDVKRRVRKKLIALVRMGGSFFKEDSYAGPSPTSSSDTDKTSRPTNHTQHWISGLEPRFRAKERGHSVGKHVKDKLTLNITKWSGANNAPPPPMRTYEALWSFMGCFLTLLAILHFSAAITEKNADYRLIIGPFGALMTLQYNLTAAPASQPRNAILGQLVSMSIAMGFTYTSLSPILRSCLATALAIMCMARLGLTHPPAGATALIVSSGEFAWAHIGIMLAGYIIAIFMATIINDMNVKRQYPTFWGFRYWHGKHFVGKFTTWKDNKHKVGMGV
eukprot:CAMPEP_0183706684 /NCGR_PEP_ID=MMETSP0737-20130205/3442_1 /TAXON_ID=385413 /ORGANISM="Thalassiosira miniscula, Strain CCMP1093" /LENGTH=577 /DNA_ID=CAMNT_0025934155 /DNA_START=327 /DNA_END=2060 /DNA_ORIENTATION=-